jgi:hypothetical protein
MKGLLREGLLIPPKESVKVLYPPFAFFPFSSHPSHHLFPTFSSPASEWPWSLSLFLGSLVVSEGPTCSL